MRYAQLCGVGASLRALLAGLRARRVYLSYGSEGHLDPAQVEAILSEYGRVEVHRFPYPVFGSGAGVARKRVVTEHLYRLDRGWAAS